MDVTGSAGLWDGFNIGQALSMFLPMIVLICTMLCVVACPIVFGRGARKIGAIVVVGIAVAFWACIRLHATVPYGGFSGLSPGGDLGMLIADNLSIFFQFVLLAFMAGVVWLWWMGSAATEENAPEFFILLLGGALGMVLMVSTTHLLMILIAIETASLPSYAIVGFDKRDRLGAEASLKYMIFGAVSAAIMLYGMSLLYGLTGSLDVADIAKYATNNLHAGHNRVVLAMGLLCFLSGILFKISAVPFHFWCPDAFEGAKVEVTTWLSVVSKAAGVILLMRLVIVFCDALSHPAYVASLAPLAWTIAIVAAVTCTVGNFAAYSQHSVKRLLAYSSIAHAGYMMMAAAIFLHPDVSGSELRVSALLMYVVIYLFMNLGAFGVTAMVIWETGGDHISNFTGLIRRAPWLAVPMIVCLVSLVGLPPFAGFIGKWWILVALGGLMETDLGWFLVIVAVANTLVSVYYYMRIVVQMSLKDDKQPAMTPPLGGIALVNGCAIALVALFVLAGPLKRAVDSFSPIVSVAARTQQETTGLAARDVSRSSHP